MCFTLALNYFGYPDDRLKLRALKHQLCKIAHLNFPSKYI